MSANVYMIGNAKGGVSKTTITTMLAYQASHFDKEKTLVIDMDSTPSATAVLTKSAGINEITKSLVRGIRLRDLEGEVLKIDEHLDLLPGSPKLDELDFLLEEAYPNDKGRQLNLLNELIEPLRGKYDRIFIDLPPNYKYYHESAILASDFCIIPMHAQDLSMTAVRIYNEKMNNTAEMYGSHIDVIGLIPVIINKDSKEEQFEHDEIREVFGDLVVDTPLLHRERLKTFSRTGILVPEDQNDRWIDDAHDLFKNIWSELKERQEYFENL